MIKQMNYEAARDFGVTSCFVAVWMFWAS